MISKRAISIFSFLAMLAISGCARHVTDANLHEVKPDMNTKEVESILGPPTRTELPPELKPPPEVRTMPVVRYIYEQDGHTVELLFVGDKLASGNEAVKGSFDK